MAKLKTKLLIVAVLGVVLAIFFPKIKAAYGKHVKPHADVVGKIFRAIKDFHIFGYHVPWKYVLPGLGLFLAVQLFRRRRRLKKLAEEQKKKDQTFMTEEEAKPVHTTNKETKTESLDNADLPSDLKDMTLVGNRVRTYMYWPSTSSVNVFELARAGFVFTGVDDVVKCFQCKGTLKMWKPGDDPMDGHREYYPDCPHVVALDALKRPVNTLTQLDDLSTVCQGVGQRLKQLCSLQSKASGVEPAKKHLTELQKRLDTTERTMHLVMKQMEAVTKCLAKTLADDPATSDDKSLAEITEGLVNLKESNV
ncbi:uncharacterized protein [Montipora foliosa]|uniref:uncharacterized protein n=1 Tax=Montipora foliosa TaxID=591990 RepID=UPI0035F18D0B